MKLSGKAVLVLGVAAIGGIAIYLYLKRTPKSAGAPQLHPMADIPPAQIYASHLGIHGDDPSAVKGDLLPGGRFSITSTENAPAVDLFFLRSTVGAKIVPRAGPQPV